MLSFPDRPYSLGGTDNCLYKLDWKGEVIWKFQASGAIACVPKCHEGIVYTGSLDGIFYAIDEANGRDVWKFPTNGFIPARRLTIANDTIFFGSWDCNLYALSLNGSVKWRFPTSLSYQTQFDVPQKIVPIEIIEQQDSVSQRKKKVYVSEFLEHGNRSEYSNKSVYTQKSQYTKKKRY